MSITVQQANASLAGMLHGGTTNKIRNLYYAHERAQNTLLSKVDPVDTIRLASLSQTVHDDLENYSLPSDYRKIIDLFPQAQRNNLDQGTRVYAENFSLLRALQNKTLSIEGSEGSKILRVDWSVRNSKTLNSNDSYNGNGTWSAVATASGIATDTIYKYSGGGSVRLDVAASGDGISNTGMTAVDLTDEDEVADIIIPIYFPSVANLTSVGSRWGNDITANYWSGVAQTTQADGSSFRAGWNIIKIPWSTATETGTVTPSTVDSFRITFAITGAINDIRVDNILFGIGYPFDVKYYSKFIFKNSSGTWISQPTTEDDTIVLDNDCIQLYLLELLIACAQQVQGTDAEFDATWAKNELMELYPKYRGEYPSQAKKAITAYSGKPRFRQ